MDNIGFTEYTVAEDTVAPIVAVAMAETFAPTSKTLVHAIQVKISAAPVAADSMTFTLDAAAGAAYDSLLLTKLMTGVTSYAYYFSPPLPLDAGDEVDIAYANTDNRTVGVRICWEKVA